MESIASDRNGDGLVNTANSKNYIVFYKEKANAIPQNVDYSRPGGGEFG
jgi:hypothetical protein